MLIHALMSAWVCTLSNLHRTSHIAIYQLHTAGLYNGRFFLLHLKFLLNLVANKNRLNQTRSQDFSFVLGTRCLPKPGPWRVWLFELLGFLQGQVLVVIVVADISPWRRLLSIGHILQKNATNTTISDTHDQTWFSTAFVCSAYRQGSGGGAKYPCS